jgi:hypothetical protein
MTVDGSHEALFGAGMQQDEAVQYGAEASAEWLRCSEAGIQDPAAFALPPDCLSSTDSFTKGTAN